VEELLRAKGVTTFGDLIDPNEKDPHYQYKLRIIASDITDQRVAVWPDDAEYYGLDPNKLPISFAVRCSVSIPFVFRPKVLKTTDKDYHFVDGGLLSNYPIWFFDAPPEPQELTHPTFGILLNNKGEESNNISGLLSFAGAIINTVLVARDKDRLFCDDSKYRSIEVLTNNNISIMDFDLNNDEKLSLWYAGYNAVLAFMEEWTWEKYQEWAKKTRSWQNSQEGISQKEKFSVLKNQDSQRKRSEMKYGGQLKDGRNTTPSPIWEGYAGKGITK
jgi:NTE family protein